MIYLLILPYLLIGWAVARFILNHKDQISSIGWLLNLFVTVFWPVMGPILLLAEGDQIQWIQNLRILIFGGK